MLVSSLLCVNVRFSVCIFPFEGRVLELLVLLDEHWQKHRLGSYKLVLLHNTAYNTAEFAKSQASEGASRATQLSEAMPSSAPNCTRTIVLEANLPAVHASEWHSTPRWGNGSEARRIAHTKI